MAQLNRKKESIHTHEGAKAKHITKEMELRRSVLACLLWENQFYENGKDIAERICSLVPKVDPIAVHKLAVEAREKMKLRHIPLLLLRECAKYIDHKENLADTIARVIQRPDELSEFVALYWAENKNPLSSQIKKGLAKAFTKFDEYQLAKWNKNKDITLKDVMFLCHPKPKNKEQEAIFYRLANDELKTPDTWEVALSAGKDKKEEWERLLGNNKLGAMALLRNLRNFDKADVDMDLVKSALQKMNTEKVLPFRFVTAAKFAPYLEDQLEEAMLKCLKSFPTFRGKTVALIDVSGSMRDTLSHKSDMTRMDAANGLAILLREICDDIRIFTFSMSLVEVPARRGFALRDAVKNSQMHSGTLLGAAIEAIYKGKEFKKKKANFGMYGQREVNFKGQNLNPDRLIVFTDEQSHDAVPDPKSKGYMINVASYNNGVGYGPWHHIDGWSEHVLSYIYEYENEFGLK
jgi:hypothetical protein